MLIGGFLHIAQHFLFVAIAKEILTQLQETKLAAPLRGNIRQYLEPDAFV